MDNKEEVLFAGDVERNRKSSLMFTMGTINFITSFEQKSSYRVKKLLTDWADAKIIKDPQNGTNFVFISLFKLLEDIEKSYRDLQSSFEQSSPALEKISDRLFKISNKVYSIISAIRFQNGMQEED